MNGRLAAGIILVTSSVPPLFLMFREVAIGAGVRAQYYIDDLWNLDEQRRPRATASLSIGDHRVELVDDQPLKVHEPFKADQDLSAIGRVQIVIDGKPYSEPAEVSVRLLERGVNRYGSGPITLFRVSESGGLSRAVVAQYFGNNQFRTISVFVDGRIVEDRFDYDGRCNPPARALFLRNVAGHPVGFCSDVMTFYPTLLFPLLYPFVSGVAGLALMVHGFWKDRQLSIGESR